MTKEIRRGVPVQPTFEDVLRDAPVWATHIAMDEVGDWHYHGSEPYRIGFRWVSDSGRFEKFEAPPAIDWRWSVVQIKAEAKHGVKLKVKKLHPDAILPTYATDGSACFDLYCYDPSPVETVLGGAYADGHLQAVSFSTGLAFEIPEGWQMLIFSRSGHGFKNNVRLSNCVGVVDADYRGEVAVSLTADSYENPLYIRHGDRIAQAQLVPVHRAEFVEVDELSETERGTGGFGSTGK